MYQLARQGAVAVITGNQPVKGEQAAEFSATLRGAARDGQPMAVVDLQRIPLIDSSGLEALLDAQDAIEQRGGSLKLAAANELCRDVLRISGVAGRFEIYSDVKSAVGSFAR